MYVCMYVLEARSRGIVMLDREYVCIYVCMYVCMYVLEARSRGVVMFDREYLWMYVCMYVCIRGEVEGCCDA